MLNEAGDMDGGAGGMDGIKRNNRNENNFHERHQRIKMVLALRDLDDMLDDDGKPAEYEVRELAMWKRRDKKVSAIIGLTLASEQLEHELGCRRRLKCGQRCRVSSRTKV